MLPDELRAALVLFASLLDERQRRLFAGLESLKCGWGGDTRIAALLGLDVTTVAHYPTATSKWNPIEHRLFCEISKNWAGRPLTDYPTVLKYLRTTTTRTGLRVGAHRVRRVYKKGVRISDDQMRKLNLTKAPDMPKWNYTLSPS